MKVVQPVQPMETKGHFWLPEDSNARVSGVLRISEISEITLELTGILGNPLGIPKDIGAGVTASIKPGDPGPTRIVGIVEGGRPITLDRCLRLRSSFGLPSGLSESTVRAEVACIGAEYEDQEEVLFSDFSFSIEGLDAWLLTSGIEFDQDFPNNKGTIHYHLPEVIPFNLPCGTLMNFSFALDFPDVTFPVTEAGVKQTAWLFATVEEPQPIEYFSSLTQKLCNFLSFALDQTLSIQSMTGYLDQLTADDQKYRRPVNIYMQLAPWKEKAPTIRWYNALFRYEHLAGRLNEIINEWFAHYETLQPAFDLYFASRTQAFMFVETKVLSLAQALETLHRRTSPDTEMPLDEFNSLRNTIAQNCPKPRRTWVTEKLRYANELTFRTRMRRLN